METLSLGQIRQDNHDVGWMLVDYLNNNPRFITAELMQSVNPDGILSEETAYYALLTGACGLDEETSLRDRRLAQCYFRRAVHHLDPSVYLQNPYYRNISIPETAFGHWKLTYQSYAPYEAFIYRDILLDSELREIPRLGFFSTGFRFPSVMENDHEWMSIKPSELETLQTSLDCIRGRVITFGLGLGYYAYMASLKPEVESITVIELSEEVIELFKKHILPQFSHPEKVKIICCDAFKYAAEELPGGHFDYAMVDLWHDTSDGLEPYLKMKKLEKHSPHTIFHYWAEESLLSALRWRVFDIASAAASNEEELRKSLSDKSLRQLASTELTFINK